MRQTKPFNVFDPFSVMSYHDLTQEARRLRRANRKLRRAIRRLAAEERHGNGNGDDFALANPAPTPRPWRGGEPENTRQTVLLSGMDCQPGQQDLFETDGGAAGSSE